MFDQIREWLGWIVGFVVSVILAAGKLVEVREKKAKARREEVGADSDADALQERRDVRWSAVEAAAQNRVYGEIERQSNRIAVLEDRLENRERLFEGRITELKAENAEERRLREAAESQWRVAQAGSDDYEAAYRKELRANVALAQDNEELRGRVAELEKAAGGHVRPAAESVSPASDNLLG